MAMIAMTTSNSIRVNADWTGAVSAAPAGRNGRRFVFRKVHGLII
jgi:hypothetical protein